MLGHMLHFLTQSISIPQPTKKQQNNTVLFDIIEQINYMFHITNITNYETNNIYNPHTIHTSQIVNNMTH